MTETKLKKAKLIPRNGEADEIVFMFNPTEICFERTARWSYNLGNRGESLLPKVNFSGIQPYKLTLPNLLFDTYERKTTVMTDINKIKKGVSKAAGLLRPPVYTFVWGSTKYFDCVMENITYKLTKFLEDGTPVRALVNITLLEVDPPSQTDSE